MIDIIEIKNLFELIAKTHPIIKHNDIDNKFYSFDAEERNSDRSELRYPNLGLSAISNKPLSGSYSMKEMGMQDKMYITVCLLDKCESGNFKMQEEIKQRLKIVMNDIVDWLYRTSFGLNRCDWPIIEYMDLSNITYNTIGPVGQNNAYGWEFRIELKGLHDVSRTDNPLNIMSNE